jgi:hypothetical protein
MEEDDLDPSMFNIMLIVANHLNEIREGKITHKDLEDFMDLLYGMLSELLE